MGQIGSRLRGDGAHGEGRAGGEENEASHAHTYTKCESENKSYFGQHFLFAGQRVKMLTPEMSLFFSENKELDLLGDRPVSFPYPNTKSFDNIFPLNVFVNVRKESVHFSKVEDEDGEGTGRYRIEFTFDADRPGYIELHFNAVELIEKDEVKFKYRDAAHLQKSEKFSFDVGADQVFNRFIFDPTAFDMQKMTSYSGGNFFPIVISLHTTEDSPQVQTTLCTLSQASDSSHSLILKPKRQRIAVDGIFFLLQELFGLENKDMQRDKENEDNTFECVVCMSEIKQTVILPCRHVCVCRDCAEHLKFKMTACPICRKPFRALLHLKAKKSADSNEPKRGGDSFVEVLHGSASYSDRTSLRGEPEERPEKRRSMRVRGHKVTGKALNVEVVKETEDGIELSNAEYFVHRPVDVIVVQPHVERMERESVHSTVSSVEVEKGDEEHEGGEIEGRPPHPLPATSQSTQVIPDPSSSDSHDSTNALLKREERLE